MLFLWVEHFNANYFIWKIKPNNGTVFDVLISEKINDIGTWESIEWILFLPLSSEQRPIRTLQKFDFWNENSGTTICRYFHNSLAIFYTFSINRWSLNNYQTVLCLSEVQIRVRWNTIFFAIDLPFPSCRIWPGAVMDILQKLTFNFERIRSIKSWWCYKRYLVGKVNPHISRTYFFEFLQQIFAKILIHLKSCVFKLVTK